MCKSSAARKKIFSRAVNVRPALPCKGTGIPPGPPTHEPKENCWTQPATATRTLWRAESWWQAGSLCDALPDADALDLRNRAEAEQLTKDLEVAELEN